MKGIGRQVKRPPGEMLEQARVLGLTQINVIDT